MGNEMFQSDVFFPPNLQYNLHFSEIFWSYIFFRRMERRDESASASMDSVTFMELISS